MGPLDFFNQGLSEKAFRHIGRFGSLRCESYLLLIMMLQDVNKNIQMVIALMGLFIFTIGHVYVRPYDAFVHDKLELLSSQFRR